MLNIPCVTLCDVISYCYDFCCVHPIDNLVGTFFVSPCIFFDCRMLLCYVLHVLRIVVTVHDFYDYECIIIHCFTDRLSEKN